MQPCCQDFESHQQRTVEDGFWIARSLWMTPYAVTLFRLVCEISGQPTRSVVIRFCPWCGRDLKAGDEALNG